MVDPEISKKNLFDVSDLLRHVVALHAPSKISQTSYASNMNKQYLRGQWLGPNSPVIIRLKKRVTQSE